MALQASIEQVPTPSRLERGATSQSPARGAIFKHFRIRHDRTAVHIGCAVYAAVDPALAARRRQILALVRKKLRRFGAAEVAVRDGVVDARFPAQVGAGPPPWLSLLDEQVDALCETPLTPQTVKELLGISGRERTRWAKDGRLAQTTPGSLRASGPISFSCHPVAAIIALLRTPEVIEQWRQEDSGQA